MLENRMVRRLIGLGGGGTAAGGRGGDRWARPGMPVTFRAELMPGRGRAERTFRVSEVLPSMRVMLAGFAGEHAASEFEPLR
ncbi:MAG TPA: hypothetical protein VG148_12655 [Pyrinomonadaceae bacterium]|nr:hypothetical protein [Pyrinomonadaceae bacterium]